LQEHEQEIVRQAIRDEIERIEHIWKKGSEAGFIEEDNGYALGAVDALRWILQENGQHDSPYEILMDTAGPDSQQERGT
jgi:predicted transcriptional regulator